MLSPHNSDGSTDDLTEEMGESSAKVTQISKVLVEQVHGGYPIWPIAIHGHYAMVLTQQLFFLAEDRGSRVDP
nr:probable sucrose-phosphate synthase 3 [Tanacetum cinerariifolium]